VRGEEGREGGRRGAGERGGQTPPNIDPAPACLIKHFAVSQKGISGTIFEQKKNPRMEAFGWPIRKPPCRDFFFAQKLCQIYLFVTPPIFDDRTLISR
jgi:hypothetical protein